MFTKERNWARWAAPRDELVAGIRLAAEEIEKSDGIRPDVSVRIVYRHGLTEQATDAEALTTVHPTDLRRIRSLWIDLRPGYQAIAELRQQRNTEADELFNARKHEEAKRLLETKVPEPKSRVSIRISKTGLELTIEGESRTTVEGLMTSLSDVLIRQASRPTWFPAELGAAWIATFGMAGLFGGFVAAIGIEGGTTHHHTHRLAAFLALGACIAIGIAFGALLTWTFPAPEILGEGERPRFRRARSQIVGALVAVALGLASIVIYALVE